MRWKKGLELSIYLIMRIVFGCIDCGNVVLWECADRDNCVDAARTVSGLRMLVNAETKHKR